MLHLQKKKELVACEKLFFTSPPPLGTHAFFFPLGKTEAPEQAAMRHKKWEVTQERLQECLFQANRAMSRDPQFTAFSFDFMPTWQQKLDLLYANTTAFKASSLACMFAFREYSFTRFFATNVFVIVCVAW